MGKKGKAIKAEINQANTALKDAEKASAVLKKRLDEESAKVQIKLNEVNNTLTTPPKAE